MLHWQKSVLSDFLGSGPVSRTFEICFLNCTDFKIFNSVNTLAKKKKSEQYHFLKLTSVSYTKSWPHWKMDMLIIKIHCQDQFCFQRRNKKRKKECCLQLQTKAAGQCNALLVELVTRELGGKETGKVMPVLQWEALYQWAWLKEQHMACTLVAGPIWLLLTLV